MVNQNDEYFHRLFNAKCISSYDSIINRFNICRYANGIRQTIDCVNINDSTDMVDH
jgi:hypothetical protein